MSKINFQKVILEEIKDFFNPLLHSSNDVESLLDFYVYMGYDIRTLLGANTTQFESKVGNLSTSVQSINNIANGELDSISNIINGFKALVSIPSNISGLSSAFGANSSYVQDLPSRTLEQLLLIHLNTKYPLMYNVLELLTIIYTQAPKNETALINNQHVIVKNHYPLVRIDLSRLGELLGNTSHLFKQEYWPNGIPNDEIATQVSNKFFSRLINILSHFDFYATVGVDIDNDSFSPYTKESLNRVFQAYKVFETFDDDLMGGLGIIGRILSESESGPGVSLAPMGMLHFSKKIGKWLIACKLSAESSGFSITNSGITFYDPTQSDFKFALSAESVRKEGDPVFHIGSMTGTRFEVNKMTFGTFLELMPPDKYYGFMIGLPDMKFVLKGGDGDGFLAKVLGSGIDVKLAFEIGWSNKDGVHFKGGGGLEKYFPEKKTIGPVDFVGLRLGIGVKFGTNVVTSIPLYASSDVKVRIGKSLTLLVESVGMQMEISFPNGDKNFGIFQVDFGFKAPNGIGIKIDSSAITGEGYLHWKDGEYIGAISLNLKNSGFTITAIGILTTKLPTGEEGYSLMVIAGVEGLKIALGMGFFITAIGGMLGLHRTMDKDAIREGLRANSLASILFPRNILENIYKIVSDINTLFPIKKDQFLIAPMARISWPSSEESFINGDIGLVIEIGSSFNIGILGRVWSRLPDEENDLIRLNVSFFGVIDFDKGELYFDAAIYDSRFTLFSIEGDIALRIFWGSQKEFLLSVGGFHPQFKPSASLKVSHMKRITIALLTDNPSLIIQFYFAITSNSLQFGARADFRFDAGVCEVKGGFGLDALIQFSPFYFTVSLYAYLGVYAFGGCVLAINLNGQLSGPGPWNFRGNASFDLCWFISVSVNIDVTWGDSAPPPLPSVKVSPLIVEEFKKLENWNVLLPNEKQSLVKLKKYTDQVVIDPMGILRVSQRIVPIEKKIDVFGGQPVLDGSKGYKISKIRNVTNNDEGLEKTFNFQSFASAQFFNYSNEQKLAIPSYEDHPAGIDIGDKAYSMGGVVQAEVQYETAIIDTEVVENTANHSQNKYNNSFVDFKKFLKGNHVATSEIATQHRLSTIDIGQVQLGKGGFEIVNNYTHNLLHNTKYSTFTEAQQVIDAMVVSDPRNIGKWSVQED